MRLLLLNKLIYRVIELLKQFIFIYQQASMRYGVKCDNGVWRRCLYLNFLPSKLSAFTFLRRWLLYLCMCKFPRISRTAKNKTRTILKHDEAVTIRHHYYAPALFSVTENPLKLLKFRRRSSMRIEDKITNVRRETRQSLFLFFFFFQVTVLPAENKNSKGSKIR